MAGNTEMGQDQASLIVKTDAVPSIALRWFRNTASVSFCLPHGNLIIYALTL